MGLFQPVTPTDVPSRLGRYQVLGRLATGGMAEVFLARDTRGATTPVIIKRVLPHLARERAFIDMFVDEANIASAIQHLNVVRVRELGVDAGQHFIVMDYLMGETLGAVMSQLVTRGERLPARIAARICADAAAGLAAAHTLTDPAGRALDVVHRDVSPDNLFVCYDGTVCLLDFGVAKAQGRLTHTRSGSRKGKFAYMSPEQCHAEELDGRSDLFSLGVVLHEITVGRRLFKRPSDAAVIRAICDEPIRSPKELDPSIPSALDQICRKVLARDRTQRHASAGQLHVELDAIAATKEALRELMEALFTDAIVEKRAMVEQVVRGEMDVLVAETVTSSDPLRDFVLERKTVQQRTSRRRGRPMIALTLAALVAAALGGGFVYRARSRPLQKVASSVAVAPAVVPTPAASPPPAVAPPIVPSPASPHERATPRSKPHAVAHPKAPDTRPAAPDYHRFD